MIRKGIGFLLASSPLTLLFITAFVADGWEPIIFFLAVIGVSIAITGVVVAGVHLMLIE